MSSKKRRSNRKYSNRINKTIPKSTKGEKSYYKLFVLYCIILIVGYYLSQYYFDVYYLEFSFLYMVVIPICFILGLFFKYILKLKKGLLYISLWGAFCITFTLYSIVNIGYIMNSHDTYSFTSEVYDVSHRGHRSPPFIKFELENESFSLIVQNEYPIEEKLEQGKTVLISGQYKKGLLSSVMIVDYTIH